MTTRELRTPFEFPPEKRETHRRAVRLEWLTVAYLVSAIVILFLTLGSSQAMKAAWAEDLLSLLPPLAFLVASRVRGRTPNARFPWGFHRAVSVAYLFAAVALFVFGSYLLVESALKLVTAEHPSIGLVEVFGQELWLGWLMLPALAWSAIPAVLLGRAKLPLANELHDKVLYADAAMNKADWMTATAAAVGVIGIGFGFWWADAAAALVISLDIVRDGVRNCRAALGELMDKRAARYDGGDPHPLIADADRVLDELDWVEEAYVRVRELGHVFHAEAFVVPREEEDLVARLEEARRDLLALDWKLSDVVVCAVSDLPDDVVAEARAGSGAQAGRPTSASAAESPRASA